MSKNNRLKHGHGSRIILSILGCLFFCFILVVYMDYKLEGQVPGIESASRVIKIEEGKALSQAIRLKRRDVSEIRIQFATYTRVIDGTLYVDLLEGNAKVESWQVDMNELEDNQFYTFNTDQKKLTGSKEEYRLALRAEYKTKDKLAVWVGDAEGANLVNGEKKKKGVSISYTVTYQMWDLRAAFLVCMALASIALAAAIIIGFSDRIMICFLLGFFSLSFMIILPLDAIPDEKAHFLRAFEISCGDLTSKHSDDAGGGGNYLPKALVDYQNKGAVIDWDDTAWMDYPGASLYSPTNYFPQAIGIKIARLFTNNVRIVFYAGRIGAYLFFLICCFLAVRFLPFGARPLGIVLLFPMTLQEGISLSADGVTIGLSVLYLSFVLHAAFEKETVERTDIVFLCILSPLLALSKIIYVVLIALVWIIPTWKFKSRKSALAIKIALLVFVLGINLGWLMLAGSYLMEFQKGVEPQKQVLHVLQNLPGYFSTIIRTATVYGSEWIKTTVGTMLGHFDVPINELVWIVFSWLYVAVLAGHKTVAVKNRRSTVSVLVLILVSGFGLTCTSLYVQWTKVGAELIEGIQGRYFIPLLPVLSTLFIISRKGQLYVNGADDRACKPLVFMIVSFLNGITIIDMLYKYAANYV